VSELVTLGVARAGDIATITLARPRQLNAMSTPMGRELAAVMKDHAGAAAIVLTGDLRAFSAGADTKEAPEMLPARASAWAAALAAMASFEGPLIAAIEGYCLGGGLELALACDLRVAGAASTFGLPEIKHGVIPAGGGTQRVPRLIGASRAKRLMLLGEPIGARAAEQWGLVDEVVETGTAVNTANDWATTIAAYSQVAVRELKRLVDGAADTTAEAGLQHERDALQVILRRRGR
jgi:enoyl-CoA hydratase/carnithine racemase